MRIKEKISIEEVLGKKFKIRSLEPLSYGEAAFTHYVHNSDDDESLIFKEEALNHFSDFLKEKEHVENIELEVAENALQRFLFDFRENIPFKSPENPRFKFIDLFAGIGGFRLALQSLGGKCVFTSEWDEKAKKTYQTNFGETPFGDITKEETKQFIPDNFEVLCAGFPCQAFSIAGRRGGFEDTRGTLFFDVAEIIKRKKPKVVFLENVKNLVSHDNGNTFRTILNVLENDLNYTVHYKVLNSMTHANIPQNRERIFIVAFHEEVNMRNEFVFPEQIPLNQTIHDIISQGKIGPEFYYNVDHQYFSGLDNAMNNQNTIYQWRRIYVRENKNNVCPTLTANMGTGGHNVPLIRDSFGIRKLTPKECFSFQGYPMNDYVLPNLANSHLYKQAGNSVTVPLIRRIGENIIKIL